MVIAVVLLCAALTAAAECWHARRCARIARLAFREPRRAGWLVLGAALLRVLAVAAVVGALALLWGAAPVLYNSAGGATRAEEQDRLLIILDASSSMNIQDAGPDGTATRADQARALIHGIIKESGHMPRTTLMTFAARTMPVVIDAKNWDVVANVMLRAYYSQMFASDNTDIASAVQYSLGMAEEWPEKSTVVLLLTDGDSPPARKDFVVPRSVREFFVLGVGSAEGRPAGNGLTAISRQDSDNLRQMAAALNGAYYNCNREAAPAACITSVTPAGAVTRPPEDTRTLAFALLGAGSGALALLPILLSLAGGRVGYPTAPVA